MFKQFGLPHWLLLYCVLVPVAIFIGYLLATPNHALLPLGTIGLVNLTAFALITPTTVLAAPLGARIAHGLSRRALSATFGVFLAIVAARMLYRTLA